MKILLPIYMHKEGWLLAFGHAASRHWILLPHCASGGLVVQVKCPLGDNACGLPRSSGVPKPAFLSCVKRLSGKTGSASAVAILLPCVDHSGGIAWSLRQLKRQKRDCLS